MACHLLCIFERVNFILSTCCVPFYLLFLLSIVQALRKPNRTMEKVSSFYWLLLSAGVADLWYLFHFYFFNRFRQWNWLLWPGNLLPHYAILGTSWLRQSQVLGTLFMAINRLHAICWPIKYQSWKSSLTIKTIIIQWLVSGALVVPAAFRCQITGPDNVTLDLIKNKEACAPVSFGLQMLLQMGVAVTLVVLYIIMYMSLRRQSARVAPSQNSSGSEQDRKAQQHLAFAGSMISLILILYACASAAVPIVVFKMKSESGTPVVIMLQSTLSTLLSIINPFVLVAMCESMRKGMVKVCYKAVGKQVPHRSTNKSRASRSRNKKVEEIEMK